MFAPTRTSNDEESGERSNLLAGQHSIEVTKTSITMAAINFANGVVGAGIVGLPSAFNKMGLILGITSCVMVATCSQYTIRLLADMGTTHNINNYLDLANRAFGSLGYILCSIFQGAFAFGAMVTYLIIFADTLPPVLSDLSPSNSTAFRNIPVVRKVVLLIAGFFILLPLSLIRSFGTLAKLGLFKLFSTLFLTVMACYFAVVLPPLVMGSEYDYACKYTRVHKDFFPALGTIAFAFVCHHQTFLVQGSLKDPTPRNFAITTGFAIFGSFALSLTVAVSGYLTFFEDVDGDLLTSYKTVQEELGNRFPAAGLLTTARLLLALNMIITYPGELMVARQTVESILSRRRKTQQLRSLGAPASSIGDEIVRLAEHRAAEESRAAMAADTWTFGRPITQSILEHAGITLGLFLASLTIALFLEDISLVLDLTGSTAAVFLSFLLPAAIRLRLGVDSEDSNPWYHSSNITPLIVFLFGIVAFVASSGFSLVNLVLGVTSEANQAKQC